MLISRKKYTDTNEMLSEQHSPPSNSREMRNRAEKMRRDKLNSYIGELATLVPMVARSSKRMDKTSILRLTATHLRIYQTLLNGKKHQLEMPKQIDQYMLEQIVCKELGGFMLILTMGGKVIFVSATVENLLGYVQTDLMGQSIYNITSQSDHEKLRTYLNSYGDLDARWRKHFSISLKRAGPRSEVPVYENVRVMSIHRPCVQQQQQQDREEMNENSSSSEIISSSTNNDILVLFIRVNRPEPISSRLMDASKNEYVTRHLVDGRIISCDHRISLVAGYMTDEVSGLSAFKFMHKDDVRWVMIALRQMYDRGETKGSSCYRLLSRNSKFIYLKTSGFLEVDVQGTVESFICINTLVDEHEGKQLIEEMRKRYSAHVNCTIAPSTTHESVEDPRKIERAVMDLIKNLPSPVSTTTSIASSMTSCSDVTSQTPSPKLNNYDETKDCRLMSDECDILRQKTATKRPPSTDLDANLTFKRHKVTTMFYAPKRPIKQEPLSCDDEGSM